MNHKNQFLKTIERYKEVYFISPHLDDAVFSAGGLISFLSQISKKTTVITVFTSSGMPPETLSAKRFVQKSGFSNGKDLFEARKTEDKEALSSLGADYLHMDIVDALWRKKNISKKYFKILPPELYHVYPVFRFSAKTGKISGYDNGLIENLKSSLSAAVPSDSIVFCPLGVGDHVDHLIVRKVCDEIFAGRIVYWSDFPYSMTDNMSPHLPDKSKFIEVVYKENTETKRKAILKYGSQIKAIFPEGYAPLIPDRFYYAFKKTLP